MIKHVNKSLVNSVCHFNTTFRPSELRQAYRLYEQGGSGPQTRVHYTCHVLLIAVEFGTVRMKALMSSYVPVVTRNEEQAGGVGQSVCSMSESAELACSGPMAP